jgi:K+-sensing histidine kinase KdpD
MRCLWHNARENTGSGCIKIGCSLCDESITFYILDSGQGYFKDKEFLHSDNINETLKSFSDTGSAINITLAKKLIHILKGTIWINWNGLSGSGFYFTIPLNVQERPCFQAPFLNAIDINR